MRPDVKWTNLDVGSRSPSGYSEVGTPGQCHRGQAAAPQAPLRQRREAHKSLSMGHMSTRNQLQFGYRRLKREYMGTDNPILSIDTKKKELVGSDFLIERPFSTLRRRSRCRSRLPQRRSV